MILGCETTYPLVRCGSRAFQRPFLRSGAHARGGDHILFAPQFEHPVEVPRDEESGRSGSEAEGSRSAPPRPRRIFATEAEYRTMVQNSLKSLDSNDPALAHMAEQVQTALVASNKGNAKPVNDLLDNLRKTIQQEHSNPQKRAADKNLEKFTLYEERQPGEFKLLPDGRGGVVSILTVISPFTVEAGFKDLSKGKKPVYVVEDRTCIACTDFSNGPSRALNAAVQSGRSKILRMRNQDIPSFVPDLLDVTLGDGTPFGNGKPLRAVREGRR